MQRALRLIHLALPAAAAAMVVTACAPPAAAVAPVEIRIATGLPGMTFRPLGDALAVAYGAALRDMHFRVVETNGSVNSMDQLESGAVEVGLALADVAYMGYNGHIVELNRRTEHVRGIAVLHPSTVHVLVAKDSNIRTLADLKGRRLGIGPVGSGTAVTSTILMRAFGVAADSVQQRALTFLKATTALAAGELDAVFITAADPVDAVRQATLAGARLLDIGGAPVQRLRVDYPFLRPAMIPQRTYPNQDVAVHTVRVDVLLLCRADLDDVLVHRLTATLFDVLPQLAASDDYLKFVDIRRSPATPIPLHPGAAWYYRERELSR